MRAVGGGGHPVSGGEGAAEVGERGEAARARDVADREVRGRQELRRAREAQAQDLLLHGRPERGAEGAVDERMGLADMAEDVLGRKVGGDVAVDEAERLAEPLRFVVEDVRRLAHREAPGPHEARRGRFHPPPSEDVLAQREKCRPTDRRGVGVHA